MLFVTVEFVKDKIFMANLIVLEKGKVKCSVIISHSCAVGVILVNYHINTNLKWVGLMQTNQNWFTAPCSGKNLIHDHSLSA